MIHEYIKRIFSTNKQFTCYGIKNGKAWGYTSIEGNFAYNRIYSCYTIKNGCWFDHFDKKVKDKELIRQLNFIKEVCI